MRDGVDFGAGAIAIVGMAGRFPGAPDMASFWSQLCSGWSGIVRLDVESLRAGGVGSDLLDHPDFVPYAARLDGIELFDAAFFDFTPRQADITGPATRLLLECAHLALEDAGCSPDKFRRPIGTFVGISNSDYVNNLATHPRLFAALGAKAIHFGNDNAFVATQINYTLDLKGPAISLATACSTSLVAVHLARRSLLSFECDLALAGGAQVSVNHDQGYLYHDGGIHSPDGHCRTFDVAAHGTVSGNGVGIVALKRLQDALADGDRIIAVIRGSAINNDGADKVGYTAPSVRGQAAAIAEAQIDADVDPEQVGYVEAHGTATPLGDPVEIAALTEAFRLRTAKRGFCAIGSLKSNLGHMGAAAGMGGLMKAALCAAHGAIPPSLHFQQANPALHLDQTPFTVNAALCTWDLSPEQRIAGVSSFGMGGTNAHVIVSGFAARDSEPSCRKQQLFMLSAKTRRALVQHAADLKRALEAAPHRAPADVAYTLAGRRDRAWRQAIVADSIDGLCHELGVEGRIREVTGSPPPLAFLFPGQGAQHRGMAEGLCSSEPVFAEQFARCAEAVQRHADIDIRCFLGAIPEESNGMVAALATTAIAQPVLFAVEYALAQLWLSWGLRPQLMLGHSLGEIVAATVAGVFELDAAVRLVVARGLLMEQAAAGAMLSVALTEDEALGSVGAGVDLAAINGPRLCVLSGDRDALEAIRSRLAGQHVECHWLDERHAFHSARMDAFLAAFRDEVVAAKPGAPAISFMSNVTGLPISDDEARDPDYWVRQLRGTVRFHPALAHASAAQRWQWLEVGPGQVLTTLVRRARLGAEEDVLASLPHAQADGAPSAQLMRTLGQLWSQGRVIDNKGLFAAGRRSKVPLPGHPLERRRHWIDAGIAPLAEPAGRIVSDHADFHVPVWHQSARQEERAADDADWLLLPDRGGVADVLLQRLRQLGAHAQVLSLDAAENRSIDATPRREGSRLQVVDLRGLDIHAEQQSTDDLCALTLDLCRLFSRVAELPQADKIALVLVSRSACAVDGSESLCRAAAAFAPFATIAAQELPGLSVRHIDLAPGGVEAAAEDILRECLLDDAVTTVALRRGRRYLRRFERTRLPRAARISLRERGCYLITGGLRGIGLTLARHLGVVWRARVVLLGRTLLPAAEDWDAWLAQHPADDPISCVVQTIREIRAAGGDVLVLAGDVADSAAMTYVQQRVHAAFGALDGIVHAAGVGDAAQIAALSIRDIRRVVDAKVTGSELLQRLFHQDELDFILHCSSQHAVKGGLGRVCYAIANAVLDSDACRHDTTNAGPVISVAWCSWSETGMAAVGASDGAGTAADEERAAGSLTNREGVVLFEQALALAAPHAVVSKVDFNQVIQDFAEAQRVRLAQFADAGTEHRGRPSGLGHDYVPPESSGEEGVASIWSELLGFSPIGRDDNFFELGGNSLLLAQVAMRLRETFSVDVAMQDLYAALTVKDQARRVADSQGAGPEADRLTAMLAELESLSDEEIAVMLNQS